MRPVTQKRLDKLDRIILQILIENSRTPLSKIAKRVRLSKPGVFKRINAMIRDEIIFEFIPITNPLSWGYQMVGVFISIEPATDEEATLQLKRCCNLWWLVRLSGRFDFFLVVLVKDMKKFYEIWGSILQKIRVRDWKVVAFDDYGFQPYELLDVKSGLERKPEAYDIKSLDHIDAKILHALRFNARANLLTLSKKTGVSADRIKRKLDQLYNRGAIQRYFTNFDIFSLGLIPYLILLKVKGETRRESLKRYLYDSKHTCGVFSMIDEWSISFIAEFYSIQEFRLFLSELIHHFPEIIEYESLLLLDQIVCDMFPQGVYEELYPARESKQKTS